ncbi:unnamed protein product [Miscanthus lutarioriparius]|uniref:Uncharacterized protein n=1 Tax=Miscanthus lutarioriparius TaxID=422564 RepID=A0A811QFM3_9POAL|nr:unnamed protein product [Miscanthus lutarioriparius]
MRRGREAVPHLAWEPSASLLPLAPSHGEEMLELGPPPLLVLSAGRQVAIVGKKASVAAARKKATSDGAGTAPQRPCAPSPTGGMQRTSSC